MNMYIYDNIRTDWDIECLANLQSTDSILE